MNAMLPWQTAWWSRIGPRLSRDQFPHALLLNGTEGIGKTLFARHLARALLCSSFGPNGDACGRCASCHLFDVGSHPDFITLAPEETGKQIPVDQVRALPGFMSLMPQHGRARVVVIEQAHAMNLHAANSLLKSLEEPPPHGMFILLTHKLSALLPTIRSRCQRFECAPPDTATAKAWLYQQSIEGDADAALTLAGGAPLRALDWLQSGTWTRRSALCREFAQVVSGGGEVTAIAEKWAKGEDAAEVLGWLESWLSDIVRCQQAQAAGRWRNPDLAAVLTRVAAITDSQRVFITLDRIHWGLRQWSTSLDQQLMLEDILVHSASMRSKS